LESLQQVRDRGVNLDGLEVCIAGDGPERSRAEALAKGHGLENVRFLGPVSEETKHELYRTAHLAIFPARFGETFGLVLIEAMNFGCATYGYANPGYADTMGPFARDCLVPPGDIAGLASLLERCLKDPEEYVYSMGYRQKEYFNRNFELDQVGARALTLYQD
jgi:glycosyltransferase involved in cell wall biosynthesis